MVKSFFHNRTVIVVEGIALALLLLTWLVVFFQTPRGDELIVLHYSIYLGIDEVGPWTRMFIFPVTGTIILIANTLFALQFIKKMAMFSYFLIFSSLGMQALLLVESVTILLRNA